MGLKQVKSLIDVVRVYIHYERHKLFMGWLMKNITEFPNFKLLQGLKIKGTLAAEGKTPEEIAANLGETFKMEGDKLKFFTNAIDVAGQNTEKLIRVQVLTLTEGESAPARATKVDEHYYLPEYPSAPKPPEQKDGKSGGGKGGRGGGRGGNREGGKPRGSPWGITPEEKEAKKNAGKAGAKEAKAEKKA